MKVVGFLKVFGLVWFGFVLHGLGFCWMLLDVFGCVFSSIFGGRFDLQDSSMKKAPKHLSLQLAKKVLKKYLQSFYLLHFDKHLPPSQLRKRPSCIVHPTEFTTLPGRLEV